MELRDLAERVLFATTLEEKLRRPESLTDERPGAEAQAPRAPGRPAQLRFKESGAPGADFPGLRRLGSPGEHGRLLHFFANHELLAAELMALALLRFPQAPAAFRRTVARTLIDEQEHTLLYVERMRACGVEFGALPVSGFFWRSVAPMEHPVDYVAAVSLTFEQANLDFARHFARAFAEAGDRETAALLERIYRDEIGHVAAGLNWFRRWKSPDLSDWDAYRGALKFPLTPRRARGAEVNADGRRAAGFDESFIAELSVFAASKGRTPVVHVFNPLAEGFIARGKAFTPVRAQASLARDLASLPMFLARQDDVVLAPRRPGAAFLKSLGDAGFDLPEFVELKAGAIDPAGDLVRRKLGGLRPWAWSPDSVALLSPLFPQLAGPAETPVDRFNPGVARLYSKDWSAGLLRRLLQVLQAQWPDAGWLCGPDDAGVGVAALEDALDAVRAIRIRGHHRVVVKQALGLAGNGALRLWEPEITPDQTQWMRRSLENGRMLVVEPWLERVADFSVHWEMSGDRLALRGFAGLENDLRGQFRANWAEPGFARRPPAAVSALFAGTPAAGRLPEAFEALRQLLEPELRQACFRGPVSADAFAFRDSAGAVRLKPVVEINPRFTMGRLTLELMTRVAPGARGRFSLVSAADRAAAGAADFPAYAADLAARRPWRRAGEPVPRLTDGALCLTDPAAAEACLAIFEVEGVRAGRLPG